MARIGKVAALTAFFAEAASAAFSQASRNRSGKLSRPRFCTTEVFSSASMQDGP